MPYVDHNNPQFLEYIKKESEEVRGLLRRLRHLVEQGHIEVPPERILASLGQHTWILTNAIRLYTVRHEYVDENDNLVYSSFEDPIAFVDSELHGNPELLHHEERDEYDLYGEFGFTRQEYEDLKLWKRGLSEHYFCLTDAFDHFANHVIRELQHARYEIELEDLVPGVGGILGIAIDVLFFVPTTNIPGLVSSCATGVLAIASKFPDVRAKLLGRGRVAS
jgi:hypothetical protein